MSSAGPDNTDGSVRRWEWGRQADVLRGHTHAVTQVSFVAGGRQVLSAGLDGAFFGAAISARRSNATSPIASSAPASACHCRSAA